MIARIVITGAPASGKSEIIQRLKALPAFSDFVFFDELARRLLEDNPAYRHDWAQFHIEIYRRQVAREDAISGRPFITDRGTADAFAFHPEAMQAVGTTLAKEHQRYTSVIQLGSAAALGEQYYRTDSIRNESIPEALAIERAITEVWQNHPAYHFVPAVTDMDEKFSRCLETLPQEQ